MTPIVPAGGNVLVLGVSLQTIAEFEQSLQGVISNDDLWSANLLAYRAPHTVGLLSPANDFPPGKYQFHIAGSTDPLLGPTNEGVGTIQLAASGSAHVSGTLGDGTPFSQDTSLVGNQLPFYASLYNGQGAVLGWITCEVVPTNFLVAQRIGPFTNYPPLTNPVPSTNIPPIQITSFSSLTKEGAPVTDILPIAPSPLRIARFLHHRPRRFLGHRPRRVIFQPVAPFLPGTNQISGSINWFKPPQIDTNYPSGFSFQTTVSGPTE